MASDTLTPAELAALQKLDELHSFGFGNINGVQIVVLTGALRELAALREQVAQLQVIVAGQLKAMGRLRRKTENCRKELRDMMAGGKPMVYVTRLEEQIANQRKEINRLIDESAAAQKTAERENRAALVREFQRRRDALNPNCPGFPHACWGMAAELVAALDKPEGA